MRGIFMHLDVGLKNQKFLQRALDIKYRLAVAIVYPMNKEAVMGPIIAEEMGLIEPIFIGPKEQMMSLAEGKDFSKYKCIDVTNSEEAAKAAVLLVKEGQVKAILKGSLETSVLLKAVLSKEGIRGGRRISNCYVCDTEAYHKPIIYTDVGINILPDVKIKADIIRNSIDVANALGIEEPKIALLSCIEKVQAEILSTTDAEALCKMDFGKAIVEGPLSFDIALSKKIAEEKNFKSKVAGDPDIVIFPNLDAGNIAVKQLELFSFAKCGSLALGAQVPILIMSRNSPYEERVLSLAFAKLYYERNKK
jgi:phosphotransacetylase